MSLNAWHLVVWGYDQAEAADFTTTSQTGRVMFVQVDNGARDKVGLAYFPIIGPYNDLFLGQRKGTGSSYTLPFSGRIDQLTFASRTWDSVNATEFYNAGTGKTYPFGDSDGASLNAGLEAYWNMEEASGSRVDLVGTANLGATGTPTQVAGKIGYAVSGDASNYLTAPTGGTTAQGGRDFTISSWIYPTASTAGYFMSKYVAGAMDYATSWNSGQITFSVYVGDGSGTVCSIQSQTGLSTSAWHLVIVDYTASTKVCANRVDNSTRYTSAAGSGTPGATTTRFTPLSVTSGSSPFVGRVDEVGFWNLVLDSTKAGLLYNGGSGRTYPF